MDINPHEVRQQFEKERTLHQRRFMESQAELEATRRDTDRARHEAAALRQKLNEERQYMVSPKQKELLEGRATTAELQWRRQHERAEAAMETKRQTELENQLLREKLHRFGAISEESIEIAELIDSVDEILGSGHADEAQQFKEFLRSDLSKQIGTLRERLTSAVEQIIAIACGYADVAAVHHRTRGIREIAEHQIVNNLPWSPSAALPQRSSDELD